jgi:hypothetical protein
LSREIDLIFYRWVLSSKPAAQLAGHHVDVVHAVAERWAFNLL